MFGESCEIFIVGDSITVRSEMLPLHPYKHPVPGRIYQCYYDKLLAFLHHAALWLVTISSTVDEATRHIKRGKYWHMNRI